MSTTSKLGPYINKLMTTVLDTNNDEFVVNLAINELTRLNVDINEFVLENSSDEEPTKLKQSKKQLLQEDK